MPFFEELRADGHTSAAALLEKEEDLSREMKMTLEAPRVGDELLDVSRKQKANLEELLRLNSRSVFIHIQVL